MLNLDILTEAEKVEVKKIKDLKVFEKSLDPEVDEETFIGLLIFFERYLKEEEVVVALAATTESIVRETKGKISSYHPVVTMVTNLMPKLGLSQYMTPPTISVILKIIGLEINPLDLNINNYLIH